MINRKSLIRIKLCLRRRLKTIRPSMPLNEIHASNYRSNIRAKFLKSLKSVKMTSERFKCYKMRLKCYETNKCVQQEILKPINPQDLNNECPQPTKHQEPLFTRQLNLILDPILELIPRTKLKISLSTYFNRVRIQLLRKKTTKGILKFQNYWIRNHLRTDTRSSLIHQQVTWKSIRIMKI